MHADGLLYENGKIRVTKNVFSNGEGAQFVIAGIKGMRDEHKGKPVILLILGLALLGLGSVYAPPFPYGQYAVAGAGAVFVGLYVLRKESWRIYLAGPQGESEAFRTRDAQVFKDVSMSLKRAISAHLGA